MPRTAPRFALLALLLLLTSLPVLADNGAVADEPTLARLSFWLAPERMAGFGAVYDEQLVPILRRHGLVESAERGRATVDSVFSRLFACPSPADFRRKVQALQQDTAFAAALLDLGQRLGATGPDKRLRHSFRLYQYPLLPAQVVPAGPGRGHWRTFDASDGLFNASVQRVLRGRDGCLWLDSDAGLYRYDGRSSVVVYPHLSGWGFPEVLQDAEGGLWLGTETGVLHYDGTSLTPLEGLSGRVWAMLEDRDGALWIGTDAGIWHYDGRTLTPLAGLPATGVSAMFQDRDGILWFATRDGIVRYDGSSFTTLSSGLTYWVRAIVQDQEGHLWFGAGDGLCRYDGRAFTAVTPRDGPVAVRSAFMDRDGGLWFGTGGRGVSRYDGSAFTTLTTLDGLAGNTVGGMLQDEDGSLWFATNAGVSRYDDRTAVTFTTRDGLPGDEIVEVVADRHGRLWLTFRSGELCRYDGRTFATYATDILQDAYGILEDREGNLWIGSGGGTATRLDGRLATVFTVEDGLPAGWWRLLEGANGELWFSRDDGLTRYDGVAFTTFAIPESLGTYDVWDMVQDHLGRIWLSTDGGGLIQFDGRRFRALGRREGLPSDRVWGLVEDPQHGLWLGTYGDGLCRYDGRSIASFTTDQGLPVDFLMRASLADREGDFWFGTDGGGAVRYDGKVFQTFDRKDGLAGNVVRAIVRDREGCVWLGCSGGLTRYCQPPAADPPIRLDAVVADRRYQDASEVVIPSTTELVAFEFHGMSFRTRPGGMVYRYRLTGHDAEWQTTREGRKEYQNLPRGTYRFEVQAVDRDLNYSEEPATVTLRVHWPYERIVLLSTLTLAVLLVIGQTGRVLRRDRRLHLANAALTSANEELGVANREIQENTRNKSEFLSRMSHDLRTPMNAIIGYTRILLRRLKGAIDARQYGNLENIQTSADNLLILINEVLDLSRIEAGRIDLKPEPVDLGQLVGECITSVAPLTRTGVELVQELGEVSPINTDADRIRRVVMNLLGNAVKFTEQGSITVSLRSADEGCELSVADTGVGIPAEDLPHIFEEFRQVERQVGEKTEGTGLGLAIAKKSVDLLGGTISAESEVGKGTTFKVRIGDFEGPRT